MPKNRKGGQVFQTETTAKVRRSEKAQKVELILCEKKKWVRGRGRNWRGSVIKGDAVKTGGSRSMDSLVASVERFCC